MLYDLHLHTHLSDAYMSPEDVERMSKAAYAKGGIADHVSPYHQIRDEKSFSHYLKEIGKFDLFRGCELCLGADLNISKSSLSKLDYIIGSVHAIRFEQNLTLFFFDKGVRFPDTALFIKIYVERIIEFLNTARIDILGHPLLLPIFLQEYNPDDLFTDEQVAAIVKAGVDNGVAFEMSSRWQTPSARFLKEVAAQNAFVSFGSDAHAPEGAFNFDYPLVMMEKCGIGWDRVFQPEKKG